MDVRATLAAVSLCALFLTGVPLSIADTAHDDAVAAVTPVFDPTESESWPGPSPDDRPIEIDNCRNITAPGHYVLTQNVTDGGDGDEYTFSSQSCLEIKSSDVVLDGRGHTVDGKGVSDTTGIAVAADETQTNVTVRDVTLTDWNRGLYVRGLTRGTVANVTTSKNAYGMAYEYAEDVEVRSATVRDNIVGVYLLDAENGTVLHNVKFGDNHAEDVLTAGRPSVKFDDSLATNGSSDTRAATSRGAQGCVSDR